MADLIWEEEVEGPGEVVTEEMEMGWGWTVHIFRYTSVSSVEMGIFPEFVGSSFKQQA